MIGHNVEHYKISGVLGEGGMGIVYKAFDLKLEREVAIKILSFQAMKNFQFIERFKREAKHQAKLNHPNIVSVYGFTEQENMLGIVMEYVEGETLEQLIRRKGKLELAESLLILTQILKGAAYANNKGFVHRDIKPSNIIIDKEGNVKIMDFGISKSMNDYRGLTKTGANVGTILYMSPEQVKAIEPTNQSDIYSIGITFYEMLSGKPPFDSDTEYEVMESHLKKNPAKLSGAETGLPNEVDIIILRALNKSLSNRYKNCEEFADDIEKLLMSKGGTSTKQKLKKIKEKTSEGHRSNFYMLTFSFIVVIALMLFFFYKELGGLWSRTFNSAEKKNVSYTSLFYSNLNFHPISTEITNSLTSLKLLDDSIGIACGYNGTIIRTTNGGKEWYSIGDSSFGNLYSISFCNKMNGVIAGDTGIILSTKDQGKTWQTGKRITDNSLFSVCFIDSSTGYIVGSNGTVLKTLDSGNVWQIIKFPSNDLLYSVGFLSKQIGFSVGWNGAIYKTTDEGYSWSLLTKLSDKYLRSISYADQNTVCLVGGGGQIYRSENGGGKWINIPSNVSSGLFKIRFMNNSEGLILGSMGEILYTSDAGRSWSQIQSHTQLSLSGLDITPSGKIFIVGYNGLILSN
jgi:eukaryotic-like serine/threonine-protein kinase